MCTSTGTSKSGVDGVPFALGMAPIIQAPVGSSRREATRNVAFAGKPIGMKGRVKLQPEPSGAGAQETGAPSLTPVSTLPGPGASTVVSAGQIVSPSRSTTQRCSVSASVIAAFSDCGVMSKPLEPLPPAQAASASSIVANQI